MVISGPLNWASTGAREQRVEQKAELTAPDRGAARRLLGQMIAQHEASLATGMLTGMMVGLPGIAATCDDDGAGEQTAPPPTP
jgi:hypothetical protein